MSWRHLCELHVNYFLFLWMIVLPTNTAKTKAQATTSTMAAPGIMEEEEEEEEEEELQLVSKYQTSEPNNTDRGKNKLIRLGLRESVSS